MIVREVIHVCVLFVGVPMYCFVQEYLKLRSAHVNSLKAAGDSPYPHKFVVTTSLTEFIEKYEHVGDGQQHPDIVSVTGVTLVLILFPFLTIVFDRFMLPFLTFYK